MSENRTPPSKTPRTPAVVLLSAAAFLVVTISFVVLKKSGTGPSGAPTDGTPDTAQQTETAGATGAAANAQKNPALSGAASSTSTTATNTAATAASAECWEGKFALKTARLSNVQKESLGERSQKIHLAEMFEKLSVRKLNEAQLCVRAAGHAVAFEKDNKDPTSILVRGGSGRIHEKASLQISYCLKAENCSPCKVKKDSFEDALLGESESDSQANADEDVTGKLSAEVRRELARLEAESKPTAIDAWELQASNTRCGRG